MMSWAAGEMKPLPPAFADRAVNIPVKDSFINVDCNGKEYNVHTKMTAPVDGDSRFSVLLLHGARFTSQTWQEVLTLQMIAVMGFSAVAIDLPRRGQTKGYDEESEAKAEFIDAFIKQLHLDRPVIISPSMSGSYSLPYLFSDAGSCRQKARGYIPIAPVGAGHFSADDYKKCSIPVMAVRGSRDVSLGTAAEDSFKSLPNKQLVVLEDAGHACYLDKPDEWHMYLYNFLTSLR